MRKFLKFLIRMISLLTDELQLAPDGIYFLSFRTYCTELRKESLCESSQGVGVAFNFDREIISAAHPIRSLASFY
jgi:hypothetical protein